MKNNDEPKPPGPLPNCRYCGLPVSKEDESITHSYWQGLPFICHKNCKAEGSKQEAYECQCVDANCNDCRHYQRGRLAPRFVSLITTKDGEQAEVSHQPNIFVGGRCAKFDHEVTAEPNKWKGMPCFEHRRAAVQDVKN